jgi:hypothetical protein
MAHAQVETSWTEVLTGRTHPAPGRRSPCLGAGHSRGGATQRHGVDGRRRSGRESRNGTPDPRHRRGRTPAVRSGVAVRGGRVEVPDRHQRSSRVCARVDPSGALTTARDALAAHAPAARSARWCVPARPIGRLPADVRLGAALRCRKTACRARQVRPASCQSALLIPVIRWHARGTGGTPVRPGHRAVALNPARE